MTKTLLFPNDIKDKRCMVLFLTIQLSYMTLGKNNRKFI